MHVELVHLHHMKNTKKNPSLFDDRIFKASMSIGIFAYVIASNDNQICEVICGGTSLISEARPVHPTPVITTKSVYDDTTIYCSVNLNSSYTVMSRWCCWRVFIIINRDTSYEVSLYYF